MYKLLLVLAVVNFAYSATESNYSDVPVKSQTIDAPLPIYQPDSIREHNSAEAAPSSRAIFENSKIPPVTLRLGAGGMSRSDIPGEHGGFNIKAGAEFRFYEPLFITPSLQYSKEAAYFGLRERGGLNGVGNGVDRVDDAKFSEFTFGLNLGAELTPQDGFFHVIASTGPFYRSATVKETKDSMRDRPAFSNSEISARGLGWNIGALANADLTKTYGIFFGVNWDLIIDSTQHYRYSQSQVLETTGRQPGFQQGDTEVFNKNAFLWNLGIQAKF